jgi:translation initiation factor IF-1
MEGDSSPREGDPVELAGVPVDRARGRVLVRFPDDEILEGEMSALDLDQPDFELVVADPGTNNRRALIPLPSVKCVTLEKRHLAQRTATEDLAKVALRFRDGEVIKGHIAGGMRRGKYGVSVELINPDGDEVELLGIPYDSLKAVFYVKSWDSRPAEYANESGSWSGKRNDTPLVDLLSELRRVADMRDRGEVTQGEYRRRRQTILDRM